MIHVRLLTAADLALGMRLKAQAGWNQTEADWRRAFDLQPDGCFVAEFDGVPVGTVTTCLFGPTGWVAMVLVEQGVRGRGVGTTLMQHALAFLDGQGARRVRLDATPLGRPLYEKLGFVAEYVLSRYEGEPAAAAPPGLPRETTLTAARPEHVEAICRLDVSATATDRRKLLLSLLDTGPGSFQIAERGGEVIGYHAARAGSAAHFLGPCIATADAGPLLLADALHRFSSRRVFLDIPEDNAPAVGLVRSFGLTLQRPLLRMCRGPRLAEHLTDLWASSGPEKG